MAHFTEGFGFNLADAFTCDVKLRADFFKGSGIAIADAEA